MATKCHRERRIARVPEVAAVGGPFSVPGSGLAMEKEGPPDHPTFPSHGSRRKQQDSAAKGVRTYSSKALGGVVDAMDLQHRRYFVAVAEVSRDLGSHLVTDGHLTAFMCRLLYLIHQGNGIVFEGDAAVPVCVGDQLGGA